MDKWLIKELYSSEKCRHRVEYRNDKGLYAHSKCYFNMEILPSDRPFCDKDICPLSIKNNLKKDKE